MGLWYATPQFFRFGIQEAINLNIGGLYDSSLGRAYKV